MTDFAVAGGLAGPPDTAPTIAEDRRRPVWVVPDQVPAIVPLSARHTEARWVARYRRRALGGDLVAAGIGVSLALVVRFGAQIGVEYLLLGCVLPITWMVCVWFERGYEPRYFGTGPEELRSILRAAVSMTAVVAIVSYATKTDTARGFVVLAVPMTLLTATSVRWWLRRDLTRRRAAGGCMRRVLVVGRNGQAATLMRHLGERVADGYTVVATCLPRGDRSYGEVSAQDLAEADILAAVDAHAVDVVAIAADPELAGQSLRRLSWALEQRGVDLIVSPGIVEVAGPRISVRPVAGLSLLHLERPSVSGGPHLIKSVFDRVVALLLVLFASPVLLAIAIGVKATSRGPVLFRQTRVGRGGAEFSMLKFRSMCVDAEERKAELHALSEGNGVLFKMKQDPRVTPIGRVLRRLSLDELPQLFNVLRGEMSLVGPRPPLPAEVALYAPDDTRRMLVKPGLTGLWQVSGRSDLTWEESVRLDLRYVDNWSMALDLLILCKTARAVLRGGGAY
ncbi:MAG: sugar transferase [Kribbellaceae bacterium]|nr:sugar transferase [Kribbellaceae bacterium]